METEKTISDFAVHFWKGLLLNAGTLDFENDYRVTEPDVKVFEWTVLLNEVKNDDSNSSKK